MILLTDDDYATGSIAELPSDVLIIIKGDIPTELTNADININM